MNLLKQRMRATILVASLGSVLLLEACGELVTPPVIEVSSSQMYLVSGGDSLITVKNASTAKSFKVTVNGQDVTASFGADPLDSTLKVGLVSGLQNGDNLLVASTEGGQAKITLTNYPASGPMISGPYQDPFVCTTSQFDSLYGVVGTSKLPAAVDPKTCAVPTQVEYVYRTNTTPAKFAKLDTTLQNWPADLATTSVNGKTVNYIVRVETGTLNRSIYQFALLHDPKIDPTVKPTSSLPGWNRRLVYSLGGGCQGGWYTQGVQQSNWQTISVLGTSNESLLKGGYAVANSTLNVMGNNCNDTVGSETLMMVKEKFIETAGKPKMTIAYGSSGGAYHSYLTADNYPGLIDGILTTNTLPDIFTGLPGLADARLLDIYFNTTNPGYFTSDQQKAVTGWFSTGTGQVSPATLGMMVTLSDRSAKETSSVRRIDPTQNFPLNAAGTTPLIGAGVGKTFAYNSQTNPTGARATTFDANVNLLGKIASGQPGAGFAQRFLDNVGVQYGLKAFNNGAISFDQFVDLNQKIGGFDIDLNQTAARTVAHPDALQRAYQSGRILSGANGLSSIPIISRVGYDDQKTSGTIVHWKIWSFALRERLLRSNGNTANHVILGSTNSPDSIASMASMDAWITGIQNDKSSVSSYRKMINNKPVDLVDACYNTATPAVKIAETQTAFGTGQCNTLYPMYTSPSYVAGAPITLDVMKCQLKPVVATDYSITLTAAQVDRLKTVFPEGVCDWSKPGVGQVNAGQVWASFGPSLTNLLFDVTK